MSAIKDKYPQLAYLIDNPEIGPILSQAEREGWSPDRFQAAIMATKWWKNSSDSARKYYNLQFTDPATFQVNRRIKMDEVRKITDNLGYEVGAEQVLLWTDKAMREGLTAGELQTLIALETAQYQRTSHQSGVAVGIRALASSYGTWFNEDDMNYWLRSIGGGLKTEDNLRAALIERAKMIYPHLAKSFDQGLTFTQITNPYRNQIAEMLELDPNTISFDDNKWRHVIDYVDPKDGTHRSMSNQELGQYIRSQNEYWNTRQGKDSAGEMVEGILTDFGAVRR